MSWLRTIFKELLGLFIAGDGSLSIAVVVWLWLLWTILPLLPIPAGWRAAVLFAGLATLLFENSVRGARRT